MGKSTQKNRKSGLRRPLLLECQGVTTIGRRETVLDWGQELKRVDALITKCVDAIDGSVDVGFRDREKKRLNDLYGHREHVLKKQKQN